MNCRIVDEAQDDLRNAFAFYEAERIGLGTRFMNEFDQAIERILIDPYGAALVWTEHRLRRLHKFPYGVVYVVDNDVILIDAVYHLHRGPDFLNERLS